MSDLISREALKEVIIANQYLLSAKHNSTDYGMFTTGIMEAIDNAPTVDKGYQEGHIDGMLQAEKLYARPIGEWYEKRIDEVYGDPPHGYLTRYEWRCSICDNAPYYENDIHTLKFCPECGAKMMKGEEE